MNLVSKQGIIQIPELTVRSNIDPISVVAVGKQFAVQEPPEMTFSQHRN